MDTKTSDSDGVPTPVGAHAETIPLAQKSVVRPPPRAPTLGSEAPDDDEDTDVKWPPDEEEAS